MARYDGVLLCSDFDGTLSDKKTISPENIEAIKYFQKNGGLFTLASGRFSTILDEMKDFFVPNTYAILLNGSQIFDFENGKYVYEGTMPMEILDFAYGLFYEINEISELIFYTYNDLLVYNRDGVDFKTFCSNLPLPIFKMIFKVPREHSDEITAKIIQRAQGKYNVGRSWVHGIDVQSVNDNKGLAVKRLRNMLGERIEKVVCVGDYENDIPMLQAADIAYAVENAIPSVKAIAHKVTVSNTSSAIAKIIYEI